MLSNLNSSDYKMFNRYSMLDRKSLLVMEADKDAKNEDIVAEAKELDDKMHTAKVVLLFKQYGTNMKNALIGLCRYEKKDATLDHMKKMGFTKGPGCFETNVFKIRDRQKLSMFFVDGEDNIRFRPKTKLQMAFSLDTELVQVMNTKLDINADISLDDDWDGTFRVEVQRAAYEETDDDMNIVVELVSLTCSNTHSILKTLKFLKVLVFKPCLLPDNHINISLHFSITYFSQNQAVYMQTKHWYLYMFYILCIGR